MHSSIHRISSIPTGASRFHVRLVPFLVSEDVSLDVTAGCSDATNVLVSLLMGIIGGLPLGRFFRSRFLGPWLTICLGYRGNKIPAPPKQPWLTPLLFLLVFAGESTFQVSEEVRNGFRPSTADFQARYVRPLIQRIPL